jgi:hypothetical protein
MNVSIMSVLIQEGTRLVSEYMRTRPVKISPDSTSIERLTLLAAGPNPDSVIQLKPQPIEKPIPLIPSQPVISDISQESPRITTEIAPASKATAIATGCVPCAMGHYGTCTGILNEAMRFARGGDISNPEVIDRVNMCMDELNSMERVDLRPEMTVQLSGWEKELAEQALKDSRAIRHNLENLQSTSELEEIAAKTQTSRQEIGRRWFQAKLQNMSPDEKTAMQKRVLERIEAMATEPTETTE